VPRRLEIAKNKLLDGAGPAARAAEMAWLFRQFQISEVQFIAAEAMAAAPEP